MPERPAEQRSDHVVLTGDVGGTFARFALARDGVLLNAPQRLERGAWPDLATACRHYLTEFGAGLRIDGAAIAAAGRVTDGRVDMTNADWTIDGTRLAGELGLRAHRVVVLNDFGALAWVLSALDADELVPVAGGAASLVGRSPVGVRNGNRVVVGPGSGLGVAALLRAGDRWVPLATEGGHASFAAETEFEHTAGALAGRRFGRVSWERMLSGPGLALLHEAALLDAGVADDLARAGDAAAAFDACVRGEPAAVRAVRTFIELLGAFAGDLALLYDASGGVIIAGGVLPRIANVMPLDGLRTRFEAKGRFSPWLASVPVGVLVSPFAALRGAAIAYRSAGDDGSHPT
jgi:glucokinase